MNKVARELRSHVPTSPNFLFYALIFIRKPGKICEAEPCRAKWITDAPSCVAQFSRTELGGFQGPRFY